MLLLFTVFYVGACRRGRGRPGQLAGMPDSHSLTVPYLNAAAARAALKVGHAATTAAAIYIHPSVRPSVPYFLLTEISRSQKDNSKVSEIGSLERMDIQFC